MAAHSEHVTVTVPVNSYYSRKLLRGHNEEIIHKIAGEFGVRINPRVSNNAIVTIRGASQVVREVVQGLITELDQKAGVVVNKYNIKSKQDISAEHYNVMRAHLDTLLPNARRELNALLQQTDKSASAQKADAAPSGEPVIDNSQFFDEPTAPATKAPRLSKAEKKALRNMGGSVHLPDAFTPRNQSQAITYLACKDPGVSLVFVAGPFGGGKTYTPLRAGFEAVVEGRVSELLIIRPTTTAGQQKPGAMPGDARAKMDPYVKGGVANNIVKITNKTMGHFEQSKVLRAVTPEFERGETYDHAFILVDEPQNLTMAQAELLIGRIGEGSIMVFAGDIGGNQNDLRGEMPGLAHLIATQGAATRTDQVLDRAAAFIAFKPEDSAARNGILPHVANALNQPPAEYAKYLSTIREVRKDFAIAQAIEGAREYAAGVLKEVADRTFARYAPAAQQAFPQLFAENVTYMPARRLG